MMMKLLLVLSAVLLIDVSLASPILKDVNAADKTHRWALTPDGEGKLHMIDLNPYEAEVEPRFDVRDIVFLLRTLSNQDEPEVITDTLASIQASRFNPNHPTRITIHGWNGSPASAVNIRTAPEYFARGNFNHITVDWTAGGSTLNYIAARNRVDEAGAFVAAFVDFLHQNGYVNFATLHVLGHSLGGQMAGIVGKRVTRGTVQVIHSFDPAGPLFSLGDVNRRVDASDAVFVEIIHTNGNLLGFGDPIGDVDFYPNGGERQPGCSDITGQCDHSRSTLFFAESINSHRFVGVGCVSYASITDNGCEENGTTGVMGGEKENYALRGMYYLRTAAEAPFALG